MKTITIENNCKQCGVLHSTFTIDPPQQKNQMPKLVRESIQAQKDYIATQHMGHKYDVKVIDHASR